MMSRPKSRVESRSAASRRSASFITSRWNT